ncbi:hypothetical protein THIX_30007 [Thiomonas sp. X19]|nr:hypothetical protein THIX_30007 [Thiomonas sp. X19]
MPNGNSVMPTALRLWAPLSGPKEAENSGRTLNVPHEAQPGASLPSCGNNSSKRALVACTGSLQALWCPTG